MGKLTYDQMRHLADLGTDGGRLTIKNKKGVVLKPTLKKWHQSQKAMVFTFTAGPPTQPPLLTGNPSLTFQQASSLPRPRPLEKR